MKTFVIFNAIACGGVALLIAIYTLVYFSVIKKRGNTVLTPARVISTLLAVSMAATIAVNAMLFAKEEEKLKNYYYPNTVNLYTVDKNDTKSYVGIFSQYADADSIPGYKRTVRHHGEVRFTYYFCEAREENVRPGFIIFVEYKGHEDPAMFSWGTVLFKWLKGGQEEALSFSSGEYQATRLMLIGDYGTSIEEMSVDVEYVIRGEDAKTEREQLIIPIDIGD